ncbi:hypothetical protein ACROYT_G007091 [Oculina patagonica]
MLEKRKRYAVTLLGIFLVTVLVPGPSAAEEESDSCQMTERFNGEMVNIKKAKENAEKNEGIVTVPKGLTVNSSADCEQSCCGNVNCTVYLFYPRPPTNDENKKYNCFFLNCRPQSLCSLAMVNVSSKTNGSVVGIRDLQQDKGNSAVELEAKDGINLEEKVSTVKPQSTTKPAEKASSTPETKNITSTSEKPSNVTSTGKVEVVTTPKPLRVEYKKNSKNHTTYASLVIALGFGTLFLFAALVLIGRPWWYAFHRPRYSKVDYLMNGL